MEIMFLNGLRYSIEFIKLMLVAVFILNVRMKKSLNHYFCISFLVVVLTSFWFDISKYSIFYGLIAFVVFFLALSQKNNIGYMVLSYIGISIVDMLLSVICFNLFRITTRQMQDSALLMPALNSISFIPIIIFSVLSKKKKNREERHIFGTYLPILILGGFSLSVYLTYTQFVGLENLNDSYQNGFVVSTVAITVGYSLICYLLLKNHAKNEYLEIENKMNQELLKAQNHYYMMLLRKEKETKMFRHDIRQHIMCIRMLFEERKFKELGEYLAQMEAYTKELSSCVSTGNRYTDMILTDLSEQFRDVKVKWEGKLPALTVSSMDMCSLFYNLLKNAYESAHRVSDKSVMVMIKVQGTNLLIHISNSYDFLLQKKDGTFRTRKQEKGHGFGIENIKKCVEKYQGSYEVIMEDSIFCTEIILPDVIKKELYDER